MAVKRILRILSALEVEEKMEMGLCIVCDKPFSFEHQSAHKNIRFIVKDEKEELEKKGEVVALSTLVPTQTHLRNGSAPNEEVQATQTPKHEPASHNLPRVNEIEDGAQKENENEAQKVDFCFPVEDPILAPVDAAFPDFCETLKEDPIADSVPEIVETGHAIVQPKEVHDNFLPFAIITTVSSASPRFYPPPKLPDRFVALTSSPSPTFCPPPEPPDRTTTLRLSHNLCRPDITLGNSIATPTVFSLSNSGEHLPPPKPPDKVVVPTPFPNLSLSLVAVGVVFSTVDFGFSRGRTSNSIAKSTYAHHMLD